MKLYLIRHGKTYGNLQGRYIGTTDEPLCREGIEALTEKKEIYKNIHPQIVYTTHLKRTKETAELLFAASEKRECLGLAEMDFGDFENKNYQELNGNIDYQRWIDSGGTLPFPNGEAREDFIRRCCLAFRECVEQLLKEGVSEAAFVVHGGTIMAVLSELARPERPYFDWQVKNGQGFSMELAEDPLEPRFLTDIRSIQ